MVGAVTNFVSFFLSEIFSSWIILGSGDYRKRAALFFLLFVKIISCSHVFKIFLVLQILTKTSDTRSLETTMYKQHVSTPFHSEEFTCSRAIMHS